MRQLILHRERALGAFGIKYHVYFNRDPQEVTSAPDQAQAMSMADFTLRNGETVRARIDASENAFYLIVFLESRLIITPPILLPPGEESFEYTIHSDFDKYKGLSLRIDTLSPQ